MTIRALPIALLIFVFLMGCNAPGSPMEDDPPSDDPAPDAELVRSRESGRCARYL
ncbi:MAG: hypothetical protein PPP56_06785 [Longimonas sp.]|uniref:hypothetical protein n=1 Tax=Longimonas sp. TaxID=2039626 RepID=UPI003348BD93